MEAGWRGHGGLWGSAYLLEHAVRWPRIGRRCGRPSSGGLERMSLDVQGIVVGLLGMGIGAVWATYGLKAFTILLPIWAFFAGLLLLLVGSIWLVAVMVLTLLGALGEVLFG